MKHIKLYFILLVNLFIFSSVTDVTGQDEIPDAIIVAIKNGNASSLSKYFNPKIELTINDMEDIYSREQAELIVKDFFSKHLPTGFTILHKGGKEGSRYAIGTLSTSANEYRVTLLIKLIDNKPYIHQLRIENENGQ